jgi:hypothetical protein
MKILKKGGVVEKRGEKERKSMPHAPVIKVVISINHSYLVSTFRERFLL